MATKLQHCMLTNTIATRRQSHNSLWRFFVFHDGICACGLL